MKNLFTHKIHIANRKQSINWQDVLYALDASQIGFKRLESISELLNVLQLMSYIYNIKEDIVMRDKCAEEFKTLTILQEKNKGKQPDWNMTYYSRCTQLNQQLEQENDLESEQSIMSMETESNYGEETSIFNVNEIFDRFIIP